MTLCWLQNVYLQVSNMRVDLLFIYGGLEVWLLVFAGSSTFFTSFQEKLGFFFFFFGPNHLRFCMKSLSGFIFHPEKRFSLSFLQGPAG